VKIYNGKISDKIFRIRYHAQGDSIDTQFNHIRRILSEILPLSVFTCKQSSKL